MDIYIFTKHMSDHGKYQKYQMQQPFQNIYVVNEGYYIANSK